MNGQQQWAWQLLAGRLEIRLQQAIRRWTRTPWEMKVQSLAQSFRYRALDLQRPRSRRRFEKYPTTNWPAAIQRLWWQGHNHNRYHSRGPWQRWVNTVANNHNKRKGGRYATS